MSRRLYRYGVNVFPLVRAPFVSLGVHIDWSTPEVTLHLPWLTVAVGRVIWIDCKTPRLNILKPHDVEWESQRVREERSNGVNAICCPTCQGRGWITPTESEAK